VTPEALQQKLRHLPTRPGVYLFKDARGEILYIGKANSLRARVRSHFAQDFTLSLKTREMIRRVADLDTIVVGSEAEALLLEANLIKSHHPRFNIQLRDDKRYPYIKVTVREPFPRIYVTRQLDNDGSRYFGPFTDVGPMRQALDVIRRLYTMRSCRYDLPVEAPARPCLDHHIGRCQAPCVGWQTAAEYQAMVHEVLELLAGRPERVRAQVEARMHAAAEALDFERAASLRNALAAIDSMARRQRTMAVKGGEQDVVGIARDGDRGCAVLLRIRNGKLLGRELDFFENLDEAGDEALLSAAATRFYVGRGDYGLEDLPREILFPGEFEDRATLEAILSETAGRRVRTMVPQKGEKASLLELASQNARHLLEEQAVLTEGVRARADDALYELQEALELKVVPRLVVCFDISHTQGTEVVASAVVFANGDPCKAEYRRFRIRGDWGNDDFRSMAEVVGRYFRRRLEEQLPLPELAVIDGGKGQLGVAVRAALEAGAADVAFISLAKREEEVFVPGRSDPIRLPRASAPLRLLQRIRDEAHRFAITYNRKLRARRTLTSELSEVAGIGPSRQRALLERFGSVRALREASPEDVAAVRGFSVKLAERVLAALRKDSPGA
jgi:excinuclease ABC subunit C